jgi:hypothetical protein
VQLKGRKPKDKGLAHRTKSNINRPKGEGKINRGRGERNRNRDSGMAAAETTRHGVTLSFNTFSGSTICHGLINLIPSFHCIIQLMTPVLFRVVSAEEEEKSKGRRRGRAVGRSE